VKLLKGKRLKPVKVGWSSGCLSLGGMVHLSGSRGSLPDPGRYSRFSSERDACSFFGHPTSQHQFENWEKDGKIWLGFLGRALAGPSFLVSSLPIHTRNIRLRNAVGGIVLNRGISSRSFWLGTA